MAALVQTIPQQTTVTMLQGRPPSPGGFASAGHPQPHPSPRRYHPHSGSGSYRGLSTAPIAPYAFTSTPHLSHGGNSSWSTPMSQPRNETRSMTAPVLPQISSLTSTKASQGPQQQPPQSQSVSLPTFQGGQSLGASESLFPDFSSWPRPKDAKPESPSMPSLTSSGGPKAIPDRYRRNMKRPDNGEGPNTRMHHNHSLSTGSILAPPSHIYAHPRHANSSPVLNTYDSYRGNPFHAPLPPMRSSADDMNLAWSGNRDYAMQRRRLSIGSLETPGLNHSNDSQEHVSPHPNALVPASRRPDTEARDMTPPLQRPAPSHQHRGSSESVSSVRSNHSSRPGSARNDRPASPLGGPRSSPTQMTSVSKPDIRLVNIAQRPSEQSMRNPSPLSRPVEMTESTDSQSKPNKAETLVSDEPTPSAAIEHLAAVNQKDTKKQKSKLRRAFSFGSATELRKATAQNNLEKSVTTPRASKRNSKYEDEMEPEQARIAEQQEAGGLGNSIYSGQGNFFTGSTDNLSISSTASSASLMLRKMGKGVKKGTRSIVGLFRPKSVIGVPAADGPVNETSTTQVSMVTVEAEREKVNVNVDPHDQPGGGTGFPRLGRNSVEAKYSTDSGTASSSRRSIVGGEKERAEVLAAVKKGILKRTDSGQSSPVNRPLDLRSSELQLPQIPHANDSPRSSAPSTPADDHPPRSGHRRTDSVVIEGNDSEDYFSSIARLASTESKSVPLTPRATLVRNISFSPRIQFHDTWPSAEYDRRGDVATCNRLTPMLAQQIKEELNNFKMEMEVHESSKVYTHFF